MVASQRVVWVGMPRGLVGGKISIGVIVMPRLSPSTSPGQLGAFPEWMSWPSTSITWSVVINGTSYSASRTSPAPSLSLWQALFDASTPVNGFVYPPLSSSALYSYPTSFVRQFFLNAYTTLASQTPTEWPDGETQLLQGVLSGLPIDDDREQAIMQSLVSQFPAGGGPIPTRTSPNAALDLTQAKLFINALTVPPPKTDNAHTPSPTPPAPDFHQALSLISRHPPLMQRLGLIVELSVPIPGGSLPNPVTVQVIPSWTPATPDTDVTPTVMTDSVAWRPQPRPSQPELASGLLRLSDPGVYQLLEMDLDGATLKTLDFTKTVARSLGSYKTFDTPTQYAMPAMRSAGMSLARTAAAQALQGSLQQSDTFNAAVTASPPNPLTLYAEDVTQGYRLDVYDETAGTWARLCARIGAPAPGPGGYVVGNPPTTVPVPAGDEGWVELGLTSAGTGSTDQCLPETLIGWRGYSLVAPRPGQHLSTDPTDGLVPESYNPATGTIPLQVAYAATPGSLPVLRFGRTYRMRARAVDLAGSSVAFSTSTAASAFKWASPAGFYGRLEPVSGPVLVPVATRTPGESLETLVIRSNYNIPDNSPSIIPCSRWVAPPTSSIQMAEQHGVLDTAGGKIDPTQYPVLSARDGQTFSTPSVMSAQGGANDTQPLNAGQQWIYYAGSSLAAPYIPDPISRGAAFQFLPGTTAAAPTTLCSFAATSAWPATQTFLLTVMAGSGAPVVPASGNNFTLTTFAPKASVTTVRLSSYFSTADLASMTLWNWLSDAGLATSSLESTVLAGQHWMFTPYRELTIVHAVQQPLVAPQLPSVTPSRQPAATYATIDGDVTFDPPSTQRLDVLAQWTEPFDDGSNPAGSILLSGNGRVGELEIDTGTPATVPLNAMREDFGDTKHRNVYYQVLATTRFLEYFAQYTTATLTGTTPATISTAGLAPGATVVTDATTSVIYQPDVDYTEDDTAGTIARLATGSIPTGTVVDVQYVVPPVTRSSLEASASPPTPQGALASVPSSARPAPPQIQYILPAFQWQTKTTSTSVKRTRAGNLLRIYLDRPWWSSGEDEQLGVIVADPPPGTVLPSELAPLVTGYGRDPLFVSGSVSGTPSVSDFYLASDTQLGVLLAEQTGTTPWVDVAGHTVSWDPYHHLWYADVLAFAGGSYWPFIRMALVRYQPNSLSGVEVSRVTQADFAQLAPDRAATLTFPASNQVSVKVTGYSYSLTAYEIPPIMTAYVETAIAGVTDAELKWSQAAPAVTMPSTTNEVGVTIWTAKLTLPANRGSQPMRILIGEYEQYATVETGDAAQRLTYFDAIAI